MFNNKKLDRISDMLYKIDYRHISGDIALNKVSKMLKENEDEIKRSKVILLVILGLNVVIFTIGLLKCIK